MKEKAPEKVYFNPLMTEDGNSIVWQCTFERQSDSQIEYTRTDVFIEKACKAYCKTCKMPNCRSNECKWISDFKGHLETI